MDKPSIGRRIWYWPHEIEKSYMHNQPFDAGIAHVNEDGTINVSIIGDQGYPITPRQGVKLNDQPVGAAPGECSWMTYHVNVAKAQAAAAPAAPEAEPQSPA